MMDGDRKDMKRPEPAGTWNLTHSPMHGIVAIGSRLQMPESRGILEHSQFITASALQEGRKRAWFMTLCQLRT